MANDLRDVRDLALLLAAHHRTALAPDVPAWARPAIYILEGCACPGQAGQYHVHALDPLGLTHWQAAHEYRRIIAAYPL